MRLFPHQIERDETAALQIQNRKRRNPLPRKVVPNLLLSAGKTPDV
jgi:hypothetical protein